jgi:hypothetical protein
LASSFSISSETARYFSFSVGILLAQQRAVRRDDDHFQLVDLVEFRRFRLRRAGHAGQLFEHTEVVLEGDGGERLVLALDLHAFLGFDGLVQAVGPAAAGHHAPGELVNDDDFAVLHHILDVAAVERVRLDRRLDVVLQVPVLGIGDVADAEQLLDFFPALVADRDRAVLLVDGEVAGVGLGLARRVLDLLALHQLGDDPVDAVILVGGFFRRARNDERRAGFVDQDGVDFVDDGEVVPALHAIAQVELHVVAQVVETVLVVGAVGDVGGVSLAALVVVEVMNDDADAQPEELVELAHPLRVALGEVVIDRDHVHAAPGEGVEVNRQGGDQRLAFAGLHFSDLALVQHQAADQLHVEMPHVEHAAPGLAHHGEGFGENLEQHFVLDAAALGVGRLDTVHVHRLALGLGLFRLPLVEFARALGNPAAEFLGLGAELFVAQRLHGRLERAYLLDDRRHALYFALVTGSKNFGENAQTALRSNGCAGRMALSKKRNTPFDWMPGCCGSRKTPAPQRARHRDRSRSS